jgi:hypothetical protein
MYQAGRGSCLDNIRTVEFRHVEVAESTRSYIYRITDGSVPTLFGVKYPRHVQRTRRNRFGNLHEHADDSARPPLYREGVTDSAPVECYVRSGGKLFPESALIESSIIFSFYHLSTSFTTSEFWQNKKPGPTLKGLQYESRLR